MKKLLVCLVLAGAIGVAYYSALGNDFVFDDYLLVVESPVVRSSQPLAHFLASPTSLGYRPFRNLSYLLDVRAGGMQPWVFRLSNLLYHWLAACFVFLIALRLTNSRPGIQSQAVAARGICRRLVGVASCADRRGHVHFRAPRYSWRAVCLFRILDVSAFSRVDDCGEREIRLARVVLSRVRTRHHE